LTVFCKKCFSIVNILFHVRYCIKYTAFGLMPFLLSFEMGDSYF
jgi:hypothetical protein